jgi:hypothetical protein
MNHLRKLSPARFAVYEQMLVITGGMKEKDKAPLPDIDFVAIKKKSSELRKKMQPAIKKVQDTVKGIVEAKKNELKKNEDAENMVGIEELMSSVVDEEGGKTAKILALSQFEEKIRSFKKSGGKVWATSDIWMKDPSYYAKLSTSDLAKECFTVPESPIFGFEVGLRDDPAWGLLRLEIMHNGFSELFKRDDFADGILSAYEVLIGKIDPASTKEVMISVALQLESMPAIYSANKEFQSQIAGKEEVLLVVNVSAIKKFIDYIEKSKKEDIVIYGETVSIVKFALVLLKDTRGEDIANKVARSIADEASQKLGKAGGPQDFDVLAKYLKIAQKHIMKAMEDLPN